MTLQKDIEIIRTGEGMYNYQLLINGIPKKSRFTYREYKVAEVTINPGVDNIIMDMRRSIDDISLDNIEDNDLFIIPVTIKS